MQQKIVRCPVCGPRRLLAESGIPLAEYYDEESGTAKKFDGKNLVNLEPLLLATAYIHQLEQQVKLGQGLYFYGRNGSGKTMLSCMIGIAATQKLFQVRFGLTSAILDQIRSFWGKDGSSTAQADMWREKMSKLDLLIIDDLGSENKGGGWASSELFRILNERLARRKATIITSQLSLESIRSGLAGGDSEQAHRLASRIEPMIAVHVRANKDYRQVQGSDARQQLLDSVTEPEG